LATWFKVVGSLALIVDSNLRRARSARSAGPSATQLWAMELKRDAIAAGVDPPNTFVT
jgi:hypothetical protein